MPRVRCQTRNTVYLQSSNVNTHDSHLRHACSVELVSCINYYTHFTLTAVSTYSTCYFRVRRCCAYKLGCRRSFKSPMRSLDRENGRLIGRFLEENGSALLEREREQGLTRSCSCFLGRSIFIMRGLLEEQGSILIERNRDPGLLERQRDSTDMRLFTHGRNYARTRRGAAERRRL